MNDIQIFNNPEFGEIRTVTIDGEPWFVAMDISDKLGYAQTANMLKQVDSEDRQKFAPSKMDGSFTNMTRYATIINESGLYAAIFGSKQENAKKFKKWVTSEVLPSIRKTGQYGQARLSMTIPGQIQLLAQGYVELEAKVDSIKEEVRSLKDDLPILPIEAERITSAAKAKGVHVIGGKDSNAYSNRSIVNAVYRDIYGQIYRNFGVKSYRALKRNQTDKVIQIISDYVLPVILQDRIDHENAQQRLHL